MPWADISAQGMQAQVAMCWYISAPRQKTYLFQDFTKSLIMVQISKFKKLLYGKRKAWNLEIKLFIN